LSTLPRAGHRETEPPVPLRQSGGTPAPALTPRGLALGGLSTALAAGSFTVGLAIASLTRGPHAPPLRGLFNDFYDYWAAARILNRGGNPYDVRLVAHVLEASGVQSTVGSSGYSYPLLLAELMRPLAALPPGPAAAVFTAGSLLALWLAVALLLSPLTSVSLPEVTVLAAAAGLFAPIDGSLYFGQVNLYLLPPLALALRRVWLPAGLGLAGAVKLYPAATLVAFAALGRRGLRPLLLTAAAMLALGVLPNLLLGKEAYRGDLLGMFAPDPYWSNESINGWLSRVPAALPVTPVMLLACAVLGALTVAVLAAPRGRSWEGAFTLMLCYSAVAAPKDSLWNFTPLIVAVVYCWWLSRRRTAALVALGLSWSLIATQGLLDVAHDTVSAHPATAFWLSSPALLGDLVLLGLLAWRVLASGREPPEGRPRGYPSSPLADAASSVRRSRSSRAQPEARSISSATRASVPRS
jgi:Glycosyltransferase family 87